MIRQVATPVPEHAVALSMHWSLQVVVQVPPEHTR
jgi:hypothetical protein